MVNLVVWLSNQLMLTWLVAQCRCNGPIHNGILFYWLNFDRLLFQIGMVNSGPIFFCFFLLIQFGMAFILPFCSCSLTAVVFVVVFNPFFGRCSNFKSSLPWKYAQCIFLKWNIKQIAENYTHIFVDRYSTGLQFSFNFKSLFTESECYYGNFLCFSSRLHVLCLSIFFSLSLSLSWDLQARVYIACIEH